MGRSYLLLRQASSAGSAGVHRRPSAGSMPCMLRNVLIFHSGALGDFVLTFPLTMALARLHPQSRIIYVTQRQKGLLAETLLRVESADGEGGWHHLYGNADALPPGPRKLLEGAHSIYSFVAQENDAWATNVNRIAPRTELCCLNPNPPQRYPGHWIDHLMQQFQNRKALFEAVRQMVQSVQSKGVTVQVPANKDDSAVLLHPGSGSPDKCWPAERFLEIAQRLKQAGREMKVLLGEVELDRWPADLVNPFRRFADVVTPATYVDLARQIAASRIYLGNDSGPSHLAGLLGVKTVAIFGPTDPSIWRPLGPRVSVVSAGDLSSIPVEQVMQAIDG
jgi:heptosyltransferase-3